VNAGFLVYQQRAMLKAFSSHHPAQQRRIWLYLSKT
jgi:hypothetical protein